jgi:spore coat polysaccharide biosynthesis predicted glycosyltransferase SpsG
VDGYEFNISWQRIVCGTGRPLLVVDDEASSNGYCADLIVNPNPHASPGLYAGRTKAAVLAGLQYALVRNEFRVPRSTRPQPSDAVPRRWRLLVTLGGSDTWLIDLIVNAIRSLHRDDLATTVIAPHRRPASIDGQITLVPFSDAMPELMRSSDFAICGGGGTNWEMCVAGIPRIVVTLAENQRPVVEALQRAGACISLGWHDDVRSEQIEAAVQALIDDPARCHDMANAGRRLVDGRGATRVAEALARLVYTQCSNATQ